MGHEDYRDIIVVGDSEDPYSWRGIDDLKQPYVNPHRWLPRPGDEPRRPQRTQVERTEEVPFPLSFL